MDDADVPVFNCQFCYSCIYPHIATPEAFKRAKADHDAKLRNARSPEEQRELVAALRGESEEHPAFRLGMSLAVGLPLGCGGWYWLDGGVPGVALGGCMVMAAFAGFYALK